MSHHGWIGVDLDGTLAHYDGWKGPDHIGPPVPLMAERVKLWLADGREVRIVTARVAATGRQNASGDIDDASFAAKQVERIQQWCLEHVGQALAVTATKDYGMVELWDDRAVQVIPNTGKTLDEALSEGATCMARLREQVVELEGRIANALL
jgi:hypothetical protein